MPSSKPKQAIDPSQTQDLPELSATTLQSLTQKIQKGFGDGKAPKAGKKKDDVRDGKPNKHRTPKSKSEKTSQDTLPGPIPNKDLKKRSDVGRFEGSSQGKKRLRDGNFKDWESGKVRVSSYGQVPRGQMKKTTSLQEPDADLRAEIQELGGEDADFDLIAGAESESEVEGPQKRHMEGPFLKDLKQFVRGLGIQPQADASTDSEFENELSSSVEVGVLPKADSKPSNTQNWMMRTKLLFQPLSEWHAASIDSLPEAVEGQKAVPLENVTPLHDYAKSLLEQENQLYAESQRSGSSSQQFYSTIMSTGTLSDKIGALTLSVQESPLHNMKALESLVALAGKRSRAQAVDVLGALKDLFGPGSLLPSDRKLRHFAAQPQVHAALNANVRWVQGKILPGSITERHLIFWAYEDWLKSTFFQMLQILETWLSDEVVFARGRAVDYVFSLLKEKPEQEANLLRLLVNKLGDTDKKIASKTSHHILQLETAHPAMKQIITSTIESDLLFRPGQSLHAQYYASITLNQTVLNAQEEDLTRRLIGVYFTLFINLLEKARERRKPAQDLPDKVTKHKVTVNRKGEVQGGGSMPGKAALKKRINPAKVTAADDELREKMMSAVLTGVNRAIPYISTNDDFFEKHLDTLFKVTHSSNFNTSIQALMLIQQIQGSNQTSVDRFYRTLYESLLDPRLLASSKQVLYLNLLYRALRSDLNVDRIKAFTKRILQVVAMHQPSFTCGAIYLIRELEGVFRSLQAFADQAGDRPEDQEEVFRDVPEEPDDVQYSNTQPKPKSSSSTLYDPRKRDPSFAHASNSSLWDIHTLTSHYHPSVSLFATRLLTHDPMPPKPDLSLNTLIHFLDRFVYKNPKTSIAKKASMKGSSLMQPLAASNKSAILVSKSGEKAKSEVPVNAEEFWKQETDKIGADEIFFHKYFADVGKRKEKRAMKKERKLRAKERSELEGGSEDEDQEEASEDEDEIWKALVGSNPDVEGDVGDEEGIDEDELEGLDEEMDDADLEESDPDPEAEAAEESGDNDDAPDDFPDFSEGDDALFESDEEVDDDPLSNLGDGFAAKGEGHVKDGKGGKKERRRRLRNLPTFASVDEYEKILGGDDEEGIA